MTKITFFPNYRPPLKLNWGNNKLYPIMRPANPIFQLLSHRADATDSAGSASRAKHRPLCQDPVTLQTNSQQVHRSSYQKSIASTSISRRQLAVREEHLVGRYQLTHC
jgi:hypothetical protein